VGLKGRDAPIERILLLKQESDIYAEFASNVSACPSSGKRVAGVQKNVSISDLNSLSTLS